MADHILFAVLDLLGTFAFAVSGAVAARHRRLDVFGVIAIAYVVACGGGILRDVSLGAVPPVGLSDWRYLATAVLAALLTMSLYPLVQRLNQPVLFFDALGLGFFAIYGAHKALLHTQNIEVAVILGMLSAVGGGMLRDILLNRTPLILQKEIYASAALLGASFQVLGEKLDWSMAWLPWAGIVLCVSLRMVSLRYRWNLPNLHGQ